MKMIMLPPLLLLMLLPQSLSGRLASSNKPHPALRFANTFSDHMVLEINHLRTMGRVIIQIIG